MRTLVAIFAILISGLAAAEAQPAQWQGEFTIVSQSGICDRSVPGDFARVRFRPGIGGDTGIDSSISLFFSRQTMNLTLREALFGRRFKLVETMYIGDHAIPIDNPVKVRFSSQAPNTITTETDFINIEGEIKGHDFQPDCTVVFKMALFRRVT
jgi:hypothetical protein